jgi:cytochrome c oxidase subunit 2
MEIHRFEKLWLALSLLLIVGFIGTVTYGALGAGVEMISDDGGTVDPNGLGDHPKFGSPGTYETDDGVEVYMIARQFLFQPGSNDPVSVPVDTPVTFYVTSADVTHGVNVIGTNVNTMIIPGQVAQFTVTFEETGSYGIVCHEYCGAAHHTMEGELLVVEQSAFNATET